MSSLLFPWLTFLVLWHVLVFQLRPSEFLAGAAGATLAMLVMRDVLRSVPLCFEPRARWIAQMWRLPGMIAGDLWILLRQLLMLVFQRSAMKQSECRGIYLRASFRTEPGCRGAAQRALDTLFLTIPPNSIVVDIDPPNVQAGEPNLLLHELEITPLPRLHARLEE